MVNFSLDKYRIFNMTLIQKYIPKNSYSEESSNIKESEIEEKVKKAVADFAGTKASEIKLTDKLKDDLGLDDLDIVELGMELSETFKIEDDEDYDNKIEKAKTVKDLIEIVSKSKKK